MQSCTQHSYPRLEIHAERSAGMLARIADLLARFDVLPAEWRARQSCAGLWIRLDVAIETRLAQCLAEKLRAMFGIQAVILIIVPQALNADTVPALSEDDRTCYRLGDEQLEYC